MHWISSDEELALAASVCRPEYHGQHCMTGVSIRKEVFTGVSPVPGARPTQRFLNREHMRKIELEPWQRTIVLNNRGHFCPWALSFGRLSRDQPCTGTSCGRRALVRVFAISVHQ